MKIVNTTPPNYARICEILPSVKTNPRIIFTYGDTIYIPDIKVTALREEVMKHEETHQVQQSSFKTPDEWWEKYLTDKKFRFDQELEAYRAQYAIIKLLPKQKRKLFLNVISKDLAAPWYDNIVSTREQARKLIMEGV